VVPEHSARMNLPNEIVFPVNANHRSICRYPSVRNQTYILVEGAIKEVVASAEGGLCISPFRLPTTYLTSHPSFSGEVGYDQSRATPAPDHIGTIFKTLLWIEGI
jgi:hypothetical protein